MKISIKKYVDDASLTWEERYRKLEAHHTEETTYLIERGRAAEREMSRNFDLLVACRAQVTKLRNMAKLLDEFCDASDLMMTTGDNRHIAVPLAHLVAGWRAAKRTP